jgi:hypothetical protein
MIKLLNKIIAILKKRNIIRTKDISDTYHTIGELYEHRMVLTAALFNTWHRNSYITCGKSWLHHDDTMFDGMFIVFAEIDGDQISYHYNADHWDLFDILEIEKAPEWDGHSSDDVVASLIEYCAGV